MGRSSDPAKGNRKYFLKIIVKPSLGQPESTIIYPCRNLAKIYYTGGNILGVG